MKKIDKPCEAYKCKDCVFWVKREVGSTIVLKESDVFGECHRFPPRSDGYTTNYPITKVGNWCGEFKS